MIVINPIWHCLLHANAVKFDGMLIIASLALVLEAA